jgi:NodT family efflux transporter outer membrane factor (OMF) lipoprotein
MVRAIPAHEPTTNRMSLHSLMNRNIIWLATLACLPLCTGCVVGPDYCPPQTPAPDTWHQELEEGDYVGSSELHQWWTGLNDPMLDELIERADDGNLDLYAALTRIHQARAQVCIARSARLARLDKVGSFRNSQQSLNALAFNLEPGQESFIQLGLDLWSKSVDLSWEPDVFGRVQRQIESACATTQASVEAYRDVLVLLYSEVATNYVRVRTTQTQLEYARRNVALQEKALELAIRRVDAGVAPILDQHQAESNLASTEAEIPPLESRLAQDLNRLSVLLGEFPGSLYESLASPKPIPVPSKVPENVPCDMVRQRPDVRRAERLLAARYADLGVAIADLYPRFTINGSFGLQSQTLSNLYSGDSWTHNIGPGFSWPIFQGFRIMCNIDAADAAVEEATATYEQTILLAVEEVESAVVRFNNERERYEALQRSVVAAERTLDSVLATYRAGKTDFLNVVAALQTLATAQNARAFSEGQIVQELITLYKALGGGWDPNHHCREVCVRLGCANRAVATVVDVPLTDDPSERYFGLGSETDEPGQAMDEPFAAPLPTIIPDVSVGDDAPVEDDMPVEDDTPSGDEPEPIESLLQRKVEELEQRLRQPVSDPPHSTGEDLPAPG